MTAPEKGPSQRQLRVGELVRHALADILARGEIADPDLDGVVISVAEVRMSPDLKNGTALVMPLGGRNVNKVMAGLERSRKWLRGRIARRVDLKFAPDIRFQLDTRFDDDDAVTALLHRPEVARDLDEE
ncbi:30S ribosome-binding factor RbfA [Pinisolibacter sp.]|uniref:30S ribosome-binding factor RbfA n=1 Tax=Pinisolibacter sp. TaxID=2172024 RepID=UPI002FDC7E92